MCAQKLLYSAVILGFSPWWGWDAGRVKDLTAGGLESITNTFSIQGHNHDVIWNGRTEFDFFSLVPGATTTSVNIIIKMSLVCKMLRTDTGPQCFLTGSISRLKTSLLLRDHTAHGVVFSLYVSNYILLCFLILCWFVHAQGFCKVHLCVAESWCTLIREMGTCAFVSVGTWDCYHSCWVNTDSLVLNH